MNDRIVVFLNFPLLREATSFRRRLLLRQSFRGRYSQRLPFCLLLHIPASCGYCGYSLNSGTFSPATPKDVALEIGWKVNQSDARYWLQKSTTSIISTK